MIEEWESWVPATREPHPLDEPEAEGDDWIEWGGEGILAVGFTEGGAPFGVAEWEFRDEGRRMYPGKGWARAATALRQVLMDQGVRDARDAVGWVRYVGEGLTYVTYGATCLSPDGQEIPLVVRLPRSGAQGEQEAKAQRETRLLRYLETMDLPFRVPRAVAIVPVEEGLAVVQEWVEGVPADLRASRFPGGRPWELVGGIAAAVHSLDPEPLRDFLPGYGKRRDHALAFARILESVPGPEGEEARAWVREHLPKGNEPSCLLHGDLLGQNLHLPLEGEGPGVVDWSEAILGDPAYDLAIVTRGVRKPFQTSGGLHHLLERYNDRAARTLSPPDIHLHELCLQAGFYADAVITHGAESAHAKNVGRALTGVLSRAQTSTGSP